MVQAKEFLDTSKVSQRLLDHVEENVDDTLLVTLTVNKFDDKELKQELEKKYIKDVTPSTYDRDNRIETNKIKKKLQSKINQKFIGSLDIYFEVVSVSKYTPFVTLRINSSDFDELIENKYIQYIDLPSTIDLDTWKNSVERLSCESNDPECGGGTPPPPTNQRDINKDSIDWDLAQTAYGYDGTGISIGILDIGVVDVNHSDFNLTPIVRYNIFNSVDTHSTNVALVAGGDFGVAPGAQIYSAKIFSLNSISDELEWFIDQGVYLINISVAIGGDCATEYDDITHYLEYLIFTYNITVTKSAGNSSCFESGKVDMITVPGSASNVITVGASSTSNQSVALYSAYEEPPYTNAEKPNIIAPGDWNFATPGTSYAAPTVAGAIALLWEKDNYLENYPELTLAMLMAGADRDVISNKGSLTSSGLYEIGGAGLLNVYDSLKTAEYLWGNTSSNGEYAKRVYLDPGESTTVSVVWLRYAHCWAYPMAPSDYDIRIYRSDGTLHALTYSIYSNTEMHKITNTNSYRTYYDIKIITEYFNYPGSVQYVGIGFSNI